MSETFTNQSQNYGAFNRQQKNVNPLLPNKFTFFLTKLPETSLSCQSANIPDISLGEAAQVTKYNPIPHSGLNLEYSPLEVSFIVDADMNNYFEISNWMRLMSLALGQKGYSELKVQNLQPGPNGGLVSDAQLVILTNESVPNIVFYFIDAFPISLSGIELTNDVDNPNICIATVRFRYTYFTFDYVNVTAELPQ